MEIIDYKDEVINLKISKNFLKDPTIRKFLKYIRALEIIDKSSASNNDIQEIVKEIKKAGKKEVEELLNEK